jgi:hypothetical protein
MWAFRIGERHRDSGGADHVFFGFSLLTIVKKAILRGKCLIFGEKGRFSHTGDHSFVK